MMRVGVANGVANATRRDSEGRVGARSAHRTAPPKGVQVTKSPNARHAVQDTVRYRRVAVKSLPPLTGRGGSLAGGGDQGIA